MRSARGTSRALALAEPAERRRRRATGSRGDLGQHRGQRASPGDRVDVAEGAEHEQPGRAELAREELQEEQRRRIGGVKVVEDEHDRPALRRALRRNSAVASNSAEPRRFGLERARLAADRERLARSSGTIWASSAAPVPSSVRNVGGLASRVRRRGGTAPRASRPGRRPPPSSARRARGRHGLARARRAPPRGGSCRSRARRRAGRGARGRRRHHRGRATSSRKLALASDEHAARVSRRLGASAARAGRVAGSCARIACCELAKRPAGLDAELVDEDASRVLVGLERVRLPPAAVEGEHQLAAQALAQGVLADQRLELADELGMGAKRKLGLNPLLKRRDAQLVEPAGDLALGEPLVDEIREGLGRATKQEPRAGHPRPCPGSSTLRASSTSRSKRSRSSCSGSSFST